MAGKVFRIVAAFTMLVLYTSVMAASDVMALTCHCNTHSGDVHTAFNHVHKCELGSCSHHHDAECDDSSLSQITKQRCCNHDHSNDIALYIQPRTSDDDHSELKMSLLALVTDIISYSDAQKAESSDDEYGQFLLPVLSEGYERSDCLRAPPVLV